MKKFLFVIYMILFVEFSYAQTNDKPPIHPSPDSIYARANVTVILSQYRMPEYSITKLFCDFCDSSTITFIKNSAINYAKSRETSLRLQYPTNNINLNIPVLFVLPKNMGK